jgi:hypothetical protein
VRLGPWPFRGDIPVLRLRFAGSRLAMARLVCAPPRIAISSFNLRRSTPVLPIVIGRPNPSPHRPLPKDAVNARRLQTAAAEIPIASDVRPRHTSRGFLHWRFADAGPSVRRATIMGPASAILHKFGSASRHLASHEEGPFSGKTMGHFICCNSTFATAVLLRRTQKSSSMAQLEM